MNCGSCAPPLGQASLAIAMAGLVIDHAFRDRMREASELASEAMALLESLGDPTLTVGSHIRAPTPRVNAPSGVTSRGHRP